MAKGGGSARGWIKKGGGLTSSGKREVVKRGEVLMKKYKGTRGVPSYVRSALVKDVRRDARAAGGG